ncbi:MAG: hypothetical protein PHU77_00210 [Simplicispira sp.]|nr:hypothetical protein [Simplicispira sp.]
MATSPAGKQSAPRKTIDWESVEIQYRAGIRSLKDIGGEYGVSDAAIIKRARRDEWVRDLKAKIQAKADAKVSAALVSAEVSAQTRASERQIVEANAQAAADIRLAHRADIRRTRAIVARLMDELEQQTGIENAALLANLGEIMRAPDDNGQDKRNDLYQKIISLPERSKTAKTLADSLRVAVDMERQAFGMDAKGADAAPGAPGYVPPSVQIIHVAAPRREDDEE